MNFRKRPAKYTIRLTREVLASVPDLSGSPAAFCPSGGNVANPALPRRV